MSEQKQEPSKADIIKDRKKGMQITDIARKHKMDKMDVRDIVKKVDRLPKKPVETSIPKPFNAN